MTSAANDVVICQSKNRRVTSPRFCHAKITTAATRTASTRNEKKRMDHPRRGRNGGEIGNWRAATIGQQGAGLVRRCAKETPVLQECENSAKPGSGGGGNRTRVPWYFSGGIYVCSQVVFDRRGRPP